MRYSFSELHSSVFIPRPGGPTLWVAVAVRPTERLCRLPFAPAGRQSVATGGASLRAQPVESGHTRTLSCLSSSPGRGERILSPHPGLTERKRRREGASSSTG